VRRPLVISTLFVTAAFLCWVFLATRPVPGVESKGITEYWMPWVSLTGSIVSLLTGIVTLWLKFVETRRKHFRSKRS
jgi:hypothetical protein